MKIAVTGGKGGTGKSTIATALAMELSKNNRVLLLDLDVDCPDDHLILSIKLRKVKDVKTMIPVFGKDKCIKCGMCRQICMENAIVQVKGKYPFVVPEQCIGCRACKLVCPVGAIGEESQVIGEIMEGKGRVDMVSGRIRPGIEESSIVVNAVKKYVKSRKGDYDYIIIDTAAGTHCPVISALLDADRGIAVTEPTPLGNHDLELILELMKRLGIRSEVIINRSDIAAKAETEKLAIEHKSPVIAEIPYSKKIAEDYAAGRPVVHSSIKRIAENLGGNK